MPSSLAAAIAERCRRSSSGGRFNGCESSLRELRLEEKNAGFDVVVEEERLCGGRKFWKGRVVLVGEDLRGEDEADFCGELESEEGEKVGGGESGAGMVMPSRSKLRSLLWGRPLDFVSFRLGEESSLGLALRSLSFFFSLSLSGDADLEKS